jgi:hypothetical protein
MDEREDIGTRDERSSEQRGSSQEGLDRDILPGWILGFAGGIAVLLAVSAVASWLLFRGGEAALVREDPPPPALLEARAPVVLPEPRLQINPRLDMDAYRARERAILDSYGWSDREAGTARIPIDRAIELYLTGERPALADSPTGEPLDGGAP